MKDNLPVLTSRNNPLIKHIRALRQRKAREDAGQFLVEGIRPVGEAAEAGAQIDALVYAPSLLTSPFAMDLVEKQRRLGTTCLAVADELFASLADKENPQGLLALVKKPSWSLDQLNAESFAWGVALVAPQDPGNIGTILRTVDAVGASGLILLDHSVDPYHPSSVRASMGAIFWRPVVQATFADFMVWATANSYTIYGTSAHGSSDYLEVKRYLLPLILLLGSEREGLSAGQAAQCNYLLRLPMHGRATSLNLGVAAGVMLYDMLQKLSK